MYTANFISVIEGYGLASHMYADNTLLSSYCCSDHISAASAVQDLRIYIDSDVSMRFHFAKTVLATWYCVNCGLSVGQCRDLFSVVGVVSRPLAAGLQQCDTRQRFITSLVTAAVSDERRRSLILVVIVALRSHTDRSFGRPSSCITVDLWSRIDRLLVDQLSLRDVSG